MGGSGGSSSHGSAGRRSSATNGRPSAGGSGGGAAGGGGGGGGSPKSSCADLTADALLVSVRPEAKSLTVGEKLKATLADDKKTVQAVDSDGNVVGNIVIPEQAELVACLERGTTYVAEVRSIKGSSIIVRIKAKGK